MRFRQQSNSDGDTESKPRESARTTSVEHPVTSSDPLNHTSTLSKPPLSKPPLSDHPLSDHPLSDHPLSDHPLSDHPLSDHLVTPAHPATRGIGADQSLNKKRGLVIGRVSLQNTLLCKTLAKEIGMVCELASEQSSSQTIPGQVLPGITIQLLDLDTLSLDAVFDHVERASHQSEPVAIALFNLSESHDQELEHRYSGWPALKGVFSRSCEPATMVQGVRGIIAGQLWLPRRYLEQFVKKYRVESPLADSQPSVSLTRKEEQILRIMMNGSTNVEIASYLNISPHTVKTHIYNLYKKLKVGNRIEAVMWGRQHLPPAN